MNRTILGSVCAALLVVVALGQTGIAQDDSAQASDLARVRVYRDAWLDYERFVEVMDEMREPLVQALLLAYEGLQAFSPDEQVLKAQTIVNLLEGAESPLYDPAIELDESLKTGIRVILDGYRVPATGDSGTSEGDLSWNGIDVPNPSLLASIVPDLRDLLRLASSSAQRAADRGATPSGRRDALLTAQALLGMFSLETRALTAPLRITVTPGESIQAAIDSAIPGATITIEPGIYRETLDIQKSVTLQGWGPDVVIKPVNSQVGILVHSDEEIAVNIQWLTVRAASIGVDVRGNARLQFEAGDVTDCGTGLLVEENANVTADQVRLLNDGIAMAVTGSGSARLTDCHLENSTGSDTALLVMDDASVTLESSFVRNNAGNGIRLANRATLTLVDGLIDGNGLDGTLLWDQSTLHMTGSKFYSNLGYGIRALSGECPTSDGTLGESFSGTITGYGNFFADPENELVGNKLGKFCPEDLGFLTEGPD